MTEFSFPNWSGRDDGAGPEHARWHNRIQIVDPSQPGLVLLGFASDEGVRRNQGQPGAVEGPAAIRAALGSFAVHHSIPLYDAGDIDVVDGDLENAQQRYGENLAGLLSQNHVTVGLGGGHEITWASYLGVRAAFPDARLGIINLDAHFDNRPGELATSGTGFAQIMKAEAGRDTLVTAMGIAEASNTADLFGRARQAGIGWMTDDRWITYPGEAGRAVAQLLEQTDIVYLTIDLDVLPAAVAPGLSAPAAYGVPLPLVSAVIDHVAASGKLVHADIAELNPRLDNDHRTAAVAARMVDRLSNAARARTMPTNP
ncbi:formimidoylglutamase [Enteractinococcus coprophilus]|uniref:Formimidoylglutamase n=1 Tax=Enteractinococcus coprophilus TaxID=1027633 RepID=A0A543AMW7_9MICC|nr:formimidoylglutamase [Enteractinococcus coprophilus]TQL73922.1 formiminoglutamase [Enteractinococcus coprophilus]